jgi:hypothetical protein
MASLAEIKNWFRSGLKPTQTQFWTTWDSFWHKGTPIPQSAVENLEDALAYLEDNISNNNSGEKRINFLAYETTEEVQFEELVGMDIDAIAVYNQFFTDGFDFDNSSGTLKWSFESGVKYLIFYSKRIQ